MKDVKDALDELVNEFASLPSAGDKNPLSLANFCTDLEKGVMAVDAIALSIGDSEADPRGQVAALAIVTHQLMFNVRALHLLLMRHAGSCSGRC